MLNSDMYENEERAEVKYASYALSNENLDISLW